jgi:4-hydroxybenzoate polyprenyltransferase
MPASFKLTLLIYYLPTLLYSFHFKQKILLDVIILSLLYTIRVIAGMALLPANVCSLWIILFSMFLFLSLAFLKRVAELVLLKQNNQSNFIGRAYKIEQFSILTIFGVTSGFLAILILTLYLNSDKAANLYHQPQILLLLFPVLIYWVCRIWLLAIEGKILDDPVLFTIRDKVSYGCGFLVIIIMLCAQLS